MPSDTDTEIKEALLESFLNLHDKLVSITEVVLDDDRFEGLSRYDLRTLNAIGLRRKRQMSELAQLLNISNATLTTSIKRLEKRGFAERNRSSEDQRVVHVKLTRKGELAVRRYRVMLKVLLRRVLKDSKEEEILYIYSFIDRLNELMFERYLKYKAQKNKERKKRSRSGEEKL